MIRVTVELVSALAPERSRLLGVATISNDLKTTLDSKGKRGAYNVILSKAGKKAHEVWKRGRVENFDRKRLGGWDLLFLALKNIVGDRNK